MSWLQPHLDHVTPVSGLLYPVSLAFRTSAALRLAAYRTGLAATERLPVPVVVVGNLIAGGTGKTPLVLWLAKYLRRRGFVPGIVSRGYGGAEVAPHRVTADADPAALGDEPVLLARRSGCEVWIGSDRVAAARSLLAAEPACNVLISDDGLQHYALGRDVEVCVVDAARGLGNGWLMPAGPLREPPSRLSTVDAIVVNSSGTEKPALLHELAAVTSDRPFHMALQGHKFQNLLNRERRAGPEQFRGRALHAIAGIGNPQRFFHHLQDLGLSFIPHPFPDHHAFSAADLAFVGADAIVMTEKDAVKCQAFAAETHWVLPVDAKVDAHFGAFVVDRIERRRARNG